MSLASVDSVDDEALQRRASGRRQRAVRRRRPTALATLLLTVAVALPALALPGDVVTDYGVGGTHEIPESEGPRRIDDLAVRPSGEALIAGSNIGAGSGEQAFWVTEVAADGLSRRDSVNVGADAGLEFGAAIDLQPDGSSFVVGEAGGIKPNLFVASFDANGDLVPTFGLPSPKYPDGVVVLGEPGTQHATSIFAEADHLVLGGWHGVLDPRGIVWRLDATTGRRSDIWDTGPG